MDLEAKIEKFYEEFRAQGKSYSKEQIKAGIEFLNYKRVDPMPKTESADLPTLYIFRHGQTVDNANYVFCGWRDPELTDKGKAQALVLAEKLADKKIELLIASTQKRAIDTMKIAVSLNENAKNLEINTDERIKERSYGELQGKSKLEVYLEDPKKLEEIRRSYDQAVPGGESIEIVCRRVANFCDEIVPLMKEQKINVAVSCHGNSIRGFRKYFEKLDDLTTATLETPLGQDYLAYVIN